MKSFNFVYFLLTTIFVASLIWLAPKYHEYRELRQDVYDLQQQNVAHEQKVDSLRQQIQALETDPREVERVARESLGYSRPGERVIIFTGEGEGVSGAPRLD